MSLSKKRVIALVVGLAALGSLIVALLLTFSPEECPNFDCFQQYMADCDRATYVNEEQEASWGYEIIGKQKEECEIQITLLSAKEGTLGLREFEGHMMSCFYPLGAVGYPEKDLTLCTGELKEDLQELIIERLYKYIVGNLGEIAEDLRTING